MLYNIVANDRKFVIDTLNKEIAEEGFAEKIELTGRALISEKGVVWYELRDPEYHVLTWATSYPFNRQRVTVVTEEKEAYDFDEDVK